MKIVIDFDEETYEVLKHYPVPMLSDPFTYSMMLQNAVVNGTVLPKGHGRLIDAEDVDNHIIGSVDLRDCPTIIEADK